MRLVGLLIYTHCSMMHGAYSVKLIMVCWAEMMWRLLKVERHILNPWIQQCFVWNCDQVYDRFRPGASLQFCILFRLTLQKIVIVLYRCLKATIVLMFTAVRRPRARTFLMLGYLERRCSAAWFRRRTVSGDTSCHVLWQDSPCCETMAWAKREDLGSPKDVIYWVS